MVSHNYKRTKLSCYFSYLSAAPVFALPPMLFITFHDMYGISYSLLGTLILTNFCTQLSIDLIFSFFARHFNIKKTVVLMPILTALGLLIYSVTPWLFKGYEFFGLFLGTLIFSVAGGLGEVLISPIVAAIPSENPEKDMSLLHSLYAWGVVIVVVLSTVFFNLFGTQNWMYLTVFYAVFSVMAGCMFASSPIPPMSFGEKQAGSGAKRSVGIALCGLCIFIGGATENVMTNWVSSYLETVIGISKTIGDILGMALFALLLGLGRTVYAKRGGNISNILLICMAGSVVCYITAGLCPNGIIALTACTATGLCTSMLWPGTLILLEEKMPNPGVAAYALMAAGGDLGSSVAPQLMGIISDRVALSSFGINMAQSMGVTAEQIGMKTGMLVTALFPIAGVCLLLYMKKYFAKIKG